MGNKAPTKFDQAVKWLAEFLADGPKFSSLVYHRAGFSRRTVQRAQQRLGVIVELSGVRTKRQMRLPSETAPAEGLQ